MNNTRQSIYDINVYGHSDLEYKDVSNLIFILDKKQNKIDELMNVTADDKATARGPGIRVKSERDDYYITYWSPDGPFVHRSEKRNPPLRYPTFTYETTNGQKMIVRTSFIK